MHLNNLVYFHWTTHVCPYSPGYSSQVTTNKDQDLQEYNRIISNDHNLLVSHIQHSHFDLHYRIAFPPNAGARKMT